MRTGRASAGGEAEMVCHGLRLVLTVDDVELLPQLSQQLPPAGYRDSVRGGPRPSLRGIRREIRLRVTGRPHPAIELGGLCVERPPCEASLLDSLERHVDRAVAEHSPEHLALHAGVVGFGQGALLVVGASGSGKSTLVRSLVRAGGWFLSDDLAMIDDALCAHPYPRPLRHRQGARERRIDPERVFAGRMGTAPSPVRWVLVTRYRESGCFEPAVLGGGDAVLALLRHTLSARSAPHRALDVLSRLVGSARVWEGERGDSEETAGAIRRLIGKRVDGSGARP